MDLAPGIQELQQLEAGGFSPDEISAWQAETEETLRGGGFSNKEIDEYFGVKNPDMASTETYLKENLSKFKTEQAEKTNPQDANDLITAIEAGLEMSVSGLVLTGKPDTLLPENAPMYMRIASQIGTLAGDAPAMVAGFMAGGPAGAAAGGAVGSAVPVVGTVAGAAAGAVLGAGAGAMALPEGLRTALMEHYEKGDIESFSDFWERTAAITISAAKGGVIGAATAGVGGAVGKVLAKSAAPALAKTSTQLASEVVTMTTVGSALEGRVPEPQEFLDAAILIGGLHGVAHVAPKLRNMYARFGKRPTEIVDAAKADPKLAQELRALNQDIPMSGELGITAEVVAESNKRVEAKKPKVEAKPEVKIEDENVNKILDKIVDKLEEPKTPLKELAKETFDKTYTDFVDKLNPLKNAEKLLAEGKDISPEASPYLHARTVVDANAKARVFLEKGTFADPEVAQSGGKLKFTGESFDAIIKEAPNKNILNAYAATKRAVTDLKKAGKESGLDMEAAQKVVDTYKAEYDPLAKRLNDYSNRVLDYVEKSGLKSKEDVAKLKEAEAYVPYKRIFEIDDAVGAKKGGGKAGSLKEFKGSLRDIQNPLKTIVENTAELIKVSEINKAKVKFIELVETTKDQDLVKRVKSPMQKIEVSAQEVARQLDIDITEAKAIETYRAARRPLQDNQFSLFREGKMEVYETTPELATAINSLNGNPGAQSLTFKIMRGITTAKKLGITFTPEFVARNFIRDYVTGGVQGPGKKFITPLEVISAMGDIVKKSDDYYKFNMSGGANGAFLDLHKLYVEKNVFDLNKETGFFNSARNVLKKPIEFMAVAQELSEQSMRIAQYKKSRTAGKSVTESAIAARDITLDFSRTGAKMSALNAITSFMNVGVQGSDRIVKAFKEAPGETSAKAVALISVPSVLLWAAVKDDERYKRISQWQKDLFWIIPTDKWVETQDAGGVPEYLVKQEDGKTYVNKGTIYRIPKPGVLGLVFGSSVERTLDAFFKDKEEAFSHFSETLFRTAGVNYVPDAIVPVVEQSVNKSFFTGNDIIPAYLEGTLPEDQHVEYTSETAKMIGKVIANLDHSLLDTRTGLSSPMIIDNYIQSWGGSLGKYAVQVSDEALKIAGIADGPVDPAKTLSDIPFIKAFVVRYPQANQVMQDFYDTAERVEQVSNSVERRMKTGDVAGAEKLMNERYTEFIMGKIATGVKRGLAAQSNLIRNIHLSDMTPDEKRDQIDRTYMLMMQMAEETLNQLRQFEKDNKLESE
jgi:hypothetical protein